MQVTTASALLPLLLLLLAPALVLTTQQQQDEDDDISWGVFAFASGSSGTVDRWSRFDWDKMDTVAMFGDINQVKQTRLFPHIFFQKKTTFDSNIRT